MRIFPGPKSRIRREPPVPFSKELEAAREKSEANGNVDGYGFLSIELAPFYQRFYADVPN